MTPSSSPPPAPQTRAGARPGVRFGGFDPAALARAEAALKSLSGQFAGWLEDEVGKLESAHAAVRASGVTGAEGEALHTRAHDLKGLGGTYEFPIITRLAASLCRLLDTPALRAAAPLELVTAHVAAIRAMVTGDIRTDEDPRGRAEAEALEAQVSAIVSATV